jgi:hypothetical protein
MRRHRIASAMLAGKVLTAADRDYVAALHRPLLLVLADAPVELVSELTSLHGQPLLKEESVAIYDWKQ